MTLLALSVKFFLPIIAIVVVLNTAFLFLVVQKRSHVKYFLIYLFSLSLWLVIKPIRNIDTYTYSLLFPSFKNMLFVSVCCPTYLLAYFEMIHKKIPTKKITYIYGVCGVFGLLVFFFSKFFSTSFSSLSLSNYASSNASLAVNVIMFSMTIACYGFTVLHCVRNHRYKNIKGKIFIINSCLFIVAMIFGQIFRRWDVFYVFAIFHSYFLLASVLLSVRELREKVDNTANHIRSYFINNVFSKGNQKSLKSLKSIFEISEITHFPNCVILVECDKVSGLERNKIIPFLEGHLTSYNSFCIQMDETRVMVLLEWNENIPRNDVTVIKLIENIQSHWNSEKRGVIHFGIGNCYDNPTDLSNSYSEAINALDFISTSVDFSASDGNQVVHIKNIESSEVGKFVLLNENKSRIINTIKNLDLVNLEVETKELLACFKVNFKNDIMLWRIGASGIVSSVMENISPSYQSKEFDQLIIDFFESINTKEDFKSIVDELETVFSKMIGLISENYNSKEQQLLNKALDYMKENIHKNISLQEMADLLFVSKSYFKTMIKKNLNTGFIDYFTELKINKAKEMMANSSKNITEIAFELGYNSSSYFSTVFTKVEGLSPKKYQQQNLDKKRDLP